MNNKLSESAFAKYKAEGKLNAKKEFLLDALGAFVLLASVTTIMIIGMGA